MRHHRRIFLHVVGREPVIFITDEGFKKAPGAARYYAACANVLGRELVRLFPTAAADVDCNQRRQTPKRQERQDQRQ